ncbi:protein FAR1-RELATED SEQUENCE 5-like [Senna tora]|uniref:Protein FAR1-RELATED SEQUENCE n=1 Tax=Senna tora TaxID=362788 RepID=A0A834T1P4_9FABA|nr:protein FAR1-RELATED SEQUENCE 5-like [Senna tora]
MYLTPNININEFLTHFERAVEDKRYNDELVCEFNSRDKLPRLNYFLSPMVIQAAKVYTPPIFDEFQYEYNVFVASKVELLLVTYGHHYIARHSTLSGLSPPVIVPIVRPYCSVTVPSVPSQSSAVTTPM